MKVVESAHFQMVRQKGRLSEKTIETVAFVVHGGTIMAIMEKYGTPKGNFYGRQVKNAEFAKLDMKLEKFK